MSFPTVYKKDTGQIVQTGMIWCEDDVVEQNFNARLAYYGAETHAIINADANAETQYVAVVGDQVLVVDRPPVPYLVDKTTIIAGGDDFCTISGLHDPCEVIIDDPDPLVETVVETVTGGSFEFAAETPGDYTIQIQKFPFLAMTLVINAITPDPSFLADVSDEFA
jgi:hypothetical protein